jgi:hypothetical protein
VGGAGHQDEAVLPGQLDHLAAQLVDVFASAIDVAADARADLDDGGVHLGLDALLEAELALREHLGLDVGAQVAVTGSMVWYSSSMPRDGRMMLGYRGRGSGIPLGG